MPAIVESMAYAGQTPWHGLGVRVEDNLTPDEMLDAANLRWSIEKEGLITASGIKVPDIHSLTRVRPDGSRDSLGVCGPDYTPFQNDEVFSFFKRFVDAGDMQMHTAGSLRDGKMVWGLAKIDDAFELAGGDKTEGYLLLSSPHQWGKGFKALFTSVRVVCNNTLTYALQQDGHAAFTMPHITAFDDNVKAAAEEALGLSHHQMSVAKEQAEFLASVPADYTQLTHYMARLFEPEETLEEANDDVIVEFKNRNTQAALDAVYTQPGAMMTSARGTWWGAANAVTFLADHKMGRGADARLENAWFGQRARLKRKAVETALEFARAA